jgi:hypothetical protein
MAKSKSYDSFPAIIWDKFKVYVGLSTMYDWEKRIVEWKEAKEIAVSKTLDFMETRLAVKISGQEFKGIDSKKIDSYCLMGALARRFPHIYSDKSQVEISADPVKLIIEGLDD